MGLGEEFCLFVGSEGESSASLWGQEESSVMKLTRENKPSEWISLSLLFNEQYVFLPASVQLPQDLY